MSKPSLSSFFSSPVLRKCARFFGVSQIGKKVYFYLFAPANCIISITIGGIIARFYAKNYGSLIYLTKTIYRKEAEEIEVIATLIDAVKEGDICYDIGAFIGLHAIFLSKKAGENGKVVSFEPYSLHRHALQDNIMLNNVKNISVIDVALGNKTETGLITGDDFTIHTISYAKQGPLDERVTVVIGDDLVKEKHLPLPNVVKIDVDGFEYATLKGLENTLKNPTCRFLSCEVHPFLLPAGVTQEMIIDLVKSFGFSNVKIYNLKDVFHIFCKK